jgi:hypothetical protein
MRNPVAKITSSFDYSHEYKPSEERSWIHRRKVRVIACEIPSITTKEGEGDQAGLHITKSPIIMLPAPKYVRRWERRTTATRRLYRVKNCIEYESCEPFIEKDLR